MSVAIRLQAYTGAIAMVAVSTLVGLWIAPRWGTAAVDMIYLPSVLAAAALWGLGPALLSGFAAALAYNFFFTEPIHTFRMDRVTDVVTVVILLIVALVTSKLAAGIREQARIAAAHAARNATIAGFAGRLLSCSTEQEIALTASGELHHLFNCNVMLVSGLPEPHVIGAVPEGNRLTPSDVAAAALTLESGQSAGRATPRLQPAEWQFHAVRSPKGILAAAGLARDDGRPPVEEDELPLLMNLLDQVSLALGRARSDADRSEVTALRERDRLRSALLSSVGHDLRTPLTGIIGAAAELRRETGKGEPLVETIASEAGKLERYISREELTNYQNAFVAAQAALAEARQGVVQAEANRGAAAKTFAASEALIAGTSVDTNPDVAAAKAALDQAKLDLERTVIRAPIDGVVTNRQVQVGQRVSAGTTVMTIVPVGSVYVDANFKEGQLKRVREGQPATLTSDLYGSKVVYRGRVVGFSGGTGSAFALIPAQNATGNWIKVVQRLPVRIALDPRELTAHPLRVGLSMDATIDVSGTR